jgi:hypothetical protein
MKKSTSVILLLFLTIFTACTTGSRNPSSEKEWEEIDQRIEKLDHHLHRSGAM